MELNNFIEKCREQFVDADEIDLNENTLFREIGSYDSLTGMSILFMIKDEFNSLKWMLYLAFCLSVFCYVY